MQRAVHFDGAAAEGSDPVGAGIEDRGSAPVDRSTTGVVVGIPEDHGAAPGRGATDVSELGADEDSGGAGTARGTEDVVGAGEREAATGIAAQAIGVVRAHTEGRRQVLGFRGPVAAEEEGSVADVGHVQRGIERGHRQLEGCAAHADAVDGGIVKPAALADEAVQTATGVVIGIENNRGKAVDVAVEAQAAGRDAAEAAIAGDAESAARVDIDHAGTEGSAGGAGDLNRTRVDVETTGEGVGSTGNAQSAVTGGGTAKFVEACAAADQAGEFEEAGSTRGGVHVGESAVERRRAGDLEGVAIAARKRKSVVGDREIPDLDLIARIGGDAIHVDDGRAGHGDIDAVGGRVAEEDRAIGAAAVAVEAELPPLEGNGSGCRTVGTAEGKRILGDEDALVHRDAASEAVLARKGVVRRDRAESQDAVATLGERGRAGAAIDAIDNVAEEGGACVAADGEPAGGVGGITHGAGSPCEARNGCVAAIDVELGGVVEDQAGRLTGHGRSACQGQGAVVHGQDSGDGVVPGKDQLPCPGFGKRAAGDAAGDGADHTDIPAHVNDAFAALRGDGRVDGESEIARSRGSCGTDGDARSAGDRGDRRAKRDPGAGDRLSDNEPGGARHGDGGRAIRGGTGEIDRGSQAVEDDVGADRAGAIEDQSTHVIGVHGAQAQGAVVDTRRGGQAEDVRRPGDGGGGIDVGNRGRSGTGEGVGQRRRRIGGDKADDRIVGDKAGGLIRAGSEAEDGAGDGVDVVAGKAGDIVQGGELLGRVGHLAENGRAEDTGVRTYGVAEIAVHAGNDHKDPRATAIQGGGRELDIIAHLRIQSEVAVAREGDGRDGEGGTGAVGVHAQGAAVEGD